MIKKNYLSLKSSKFPSFFNSHSLHFTMINNIRNTHIYYLLNYSVSHELINYTCQGLTNSYNY